MNKEVELNDDEYGYETNRCDVNDYLLSPNIPHKLEAVYVNGHRESALEIADWCDGVATKMWTTWCITKFNSLGTPKEAVVGDYLLRIPGRYHTTYMPISGDAFESLFKKTGDTFADETKEDVSVFTEDQIPSTKASSPKPIISSKNT